MSKRIFFTVGISLDGPENIHDEIRGKKGSFKKALESGLALKNFQNCTSGFNVVFRCTICKSNIRHLSDFEEQIQQTEIPINYGIVTYTILVLKVPRKVSGI